MKQGVSKQMLIDSLSETLKLTRERVDHLELKDNNTVIIHFEGGHERYVNIHMDSGMAIIRDVAKQI